MTKPARIFISEKINESSFSITFSGVKMINSEEVRYMLSDYRMYGPHSVEPPLLGAIESIYNRIDPLTLEELGLFVKKHNLHEV